MQVRVNKQLLRSVLTEKQSSALTRLYNSSNGEPFSLTHEGISKSMRLSLGSTHRLCSLLLRTGLMSTTVPRERILDPGPGVPWSMRALMFRPSRTSVYVYQETLVALEVAASRPTRQKALSTAFEVFTNTERMAMERRFHDTLEEFFSPRKPKQEALSFGKVHAVYNPVWLTEVLPEYPAGQLWPSIQVPAPPCFSEDDLTLNLRLAEMAYRSAWKKVTGKVLPRYWEPLKEFTKAGRKNGKRTQVQKGIEALLSKGIKAPHHWCRFRLEQMFYKQNPSLADNSLGQKLLTKCYSEKTINEYKSSIELYKYTSTSAEVWTISPTSAQKEAIATWDKLKTRIISQRLTRGEAEELVESRLSESKICQLFSAATEEAAQENERIKTAIIDCDWLW